MDRAQVDAVLAETAARHGGSLRRLFRRGIGGESRPIRPADFYRIAKHLADRADVRCGGAPFGEEIGLPDGRLLLSRRRQKPDRRGPAVAGLSAGGKRRVLDRQDDGHRRGAQLSLAIRARRHRRRSRQHVWRIRQLRAAQQPCRAGDDPPLLRGPNWTARKAHCK